MVNRDRIFLLVAVLIPTVSFAGSTVGTSTIDDSQSDVFGSSTTHGSSAPASAVTLGVTDTNVPPDIGLNKTEVVKEGYVVSQVEAITVTTHSMVRVTARNFNPLKHFDLQCCLAHKLQGKWKMLASSYQHAWSK